MADELAMWGLERDVALMNSRKKNTKDKERTMTDPKRPDPFALMFHASRPKNPSARPLRMQKLLNGTWVEMAQIAPCETAAQREAVSKLADALGGLVRLQACGHTVEEWDEGRLLVGQTRCA